VVLVALTETAAAEYGIAHRLSVNARAAGPRLGKNVQKAIQAARSGDWSEADGVVTAGGIVLEPAEYELVLETTGRPEGEALAIVPSGGFVLLDTQTTAELEAEGLARDAIRVVQEARKNADLDVSDRIVLALNVSAADAEALQAHAELIAGETLAVGFSVQATDDMETLVKDVTSPGDGVFRSGASALGADKRPIIVTIDSTLTEAGA
jgi:isoleucyl-tRNA synthetase